jgi:hypothetical protein
MKMTNNNIYPEECIWQTGKNADHNDLDIMMQIHKRVYYINSQVLFPSSNQNNSMKLFYYEEKSF